MQQACALIVAVKRQRPVGNHAARIVYRTTVERQLTHAGHGALIVEQAGAQPAVAAREQRPLIG